MVVTPGLPWVLGGEGPTIAPFASIFGACPLQDRPPKAVGLAVGTGGGIRVCLGGTLPSFRNARATTPTQEGSVQSSAGTDPLERTTSHRMSNSEIKIRMEAYDHEALDKSTAELVDTAKRTGARVRGPVPLPTRIERYTVLRSPHIDKKSREQFEVRTHKRIVFIEYSPKTVDAISKLNLPAGVDIRIKV